MIGPADKWAYSPIELGAIWHMTVDEAQFEHYSRRFAYFRRIGDEAAANIVLNALTSDQVVLLLGDVRQDDGA